MRRETSVDHFVSKSHCAQWTYEAFNLFLACHSCNSGLKKAALTITPPPLANYSSCNFTVFHPYLHQDASRHITGGFTNGDQPPRPVHAESDAGAEFIRLFELDQADIYAAWSNDHTAWLVEQWRQGLVPSDQSLLEQLRLEVYS
ncbi:hypothetical protein [Desertivibrio insolitus]|uniref:hypothetical protein n=1 Tax=Herbiconiux sp. SYSU D00978 TaxID=2812562 RepID=UPI001A95E3EB|nr:hypothetical protein [Herbiconiux sp. SYSU D00978]